MPVFPFACDPLKGTLPPPPLLENLYIICIFFLKEEKLPKS